jgi:hypothetical protein
MAHHSGSFRSLSFDAFGCCPSMSIRAIFTAPPKEIHPLYKYGMLVSLLSLLAFYIHWRLNLPPDWPHESSWPGIFALTMLLFHLASFFRWPVPVVVALRVLACVAFVSMMFYAFYWLFLHEKGT